MPTTNLPSKKPNSNPQFITLSTGQSIEVPEGADPVYFKRFEEARLRNLANPKKAKPKKSYTPKPSKKSNYARMQSVLAMATLELVERVNRPVEPEPRFINGTLEVF